MDIIKIKIPEELSKFNDLRSGQQVLLSGVIYTARDAAHLRLVNALANNEELPLPIKDQIIYYVGPTPTKPGNAFGSAGPTTSYRMDAYTPKLLSLGLKGMIGKGKRNQEVKDALLGNAIYFAAVGGAAALMGKCVVKSEVIAYEDLGSEAIRRLEVIDLPLIVVNDMLGHDLYEAGPIEYLKKRDTYENKK